MDYIEKILIKKAQKGKMYAYEKLILKYEKMVYNVAFKMFYNEQDAYDISQEVFIKVYQSIQTYNFTSKFSTWLYRITVNTCIDEIRKRKAKATLSIDELYSKGEKINDNEFDKRTETPEEIIIKKESNNEIINLINKLNDNHKTIIILRDINNLSYEEIAYILDCQLGTVKSRLSRARMKLKELYLLNMEQNNKKERKVNRKGDLL